MQRCLQKGEELRMRSIAFPVIGTGNLKFPPNTASRIMLEEVFSFCEANGSSSLKDVRFVVYQQDQELIKAFGQEIAIFRSKHNCRPGYNVSSFFRSIHSKLGKNIPASSPSVFSDQSFSGCAGPSIEVIISDMTKEKSDAIVNLIGPDMNMNNAGELSKAILREGGQQIQDECNQLGHQTAGSAVRTTGGNLAAPCIIHIIPGWNFFLCTTSLKSLKSPLTSLMCLMFFRKNEKILIHYLSHLLSYNKGMLLWLHLFSFKSSLLYKLGARFLSSSFSHHLHSGLLILNAIYLKNTFSSLIVILIN